MQTEKKEEGTLFSLVQSVRSAYDAQRQLDDHIVDDNSLTVVSRTGKNEQEEKNTVRRKIA